MMRVHLQTTLLAGALTLALGAVPPVAPVDAYTLPVVHQGGPRATATFVEDHGGWHAGIDLPLTDGAGVVKAASNETVFHVYTLAFDHVKTVMNDNATVVGPWAIELSDSRNKYMLDILRVTRVTPGKPVINYSVLSVVESDPGTGLAQDGVRLVPNVPGAGDSLDGGDQLEVDYAYYSSRIFQTAHLTNMGGEYHYYAHIDFVHDYVNWNSYPATAANRYYGTDTGVPAGRSPHVLSEGQDFAYIEQLLDFASEPRHLHFGMSTAFMFPASTINPLTQTGFPTDDPQGNRPYVRSLALLYGMNAYIFPTPSLYGRVNILIESRDDMGSPEADDDGDGAENAIREAGCYNAGYWVTADSAAGDDVASAAQPNTMFAGPGKDTIAGSDSLKVVLLPNPPFHIDVNTNYHLVASHVEEDSTRFWNTRARMGGARNDGSDAPVARVNSEARFGDGRYSIHAKARDAVAYGATRDSAIVVDNFRPFVRKVIVSDDSGELYSGEWGFDGTNVVFNHVDADDGMKDFLGRKRCADGASDVTIEVTFSEGMKTTGMSSLEPLGYTPTLRRKQPNEDSVWVAIIPKAKIRTTRQKAGRQKIEIFGTDWADNDVRAITTTAAFDPATNSRDGAVMQGPGGSDELHRFAICQAIALVIDDTGSMYDEIEAVKEAMTDVINFNRTDPDRFIRYTVVTFRDTVRVRTQTKDHDEAQFIIQSLDANFGGDCPEASVAALDSLFNRIPGGGVAILATDADPKEGRPRLEATKERLRSIDVEVNTLLSGSCGPFPAASSGPLDPESAERAATTRGNGDEGGDGSAAPGAGVLATIDARAAFHEMSNATGGLYIQSFPTAQFVDAVRIVSQRIDTGALLSSRFLIRPAPDVTTQPVAVDSSCSELLVVVNFSLGDATSLQLRRPSGTLVQVMDPDVTRTSAPAVAAIRVLDPAPGTWTAEVTTASGQGLFELSALARSPRRLTLGGAPNRRAGTPTPITVQMDGPGTPASFRLIRLDGSPDQPLTLFDDGLHADGDAGDRNYGAVVAVNSPGEYRVAMDGIDGAGSFTRETAKTILVGLPDVASVDTLDFGVLAVGRSTTRELRVRNSGTAPLTVSDVSSGSSAFVPTPTSLIVGEGDAGHVDVTWTPTTPGAVHVPVTITSDDPDEPTHTLFLTGVAVPPAMLAHAPDTLVVALPQGDSTDVTLRIRNLGPGATSLVVTDPAGTAGPSSPSYRYRTGFGAGAGVPFRWETLGPGAAMVGAFAADGAAGPFPIGFEMTLFGAHATEFYISENGHVTLGGVPALRTPFVGPCPPNSYFAPWVAAYWEDLDLRNRGEVRWHSDGERLVVQYTDAPRVDLNEQDAPLTGQIVLHRDGTVDLNYESVPPTDGRVIVGIGSGAAGEYLAPSCEILEPARERTTLHFWRDNPWLSLAPEADSLAGGDSLSVSVHVRTDMAGFMVGQRYAASLTLLNDTIGSPRRDVPVRLDILPGPYAVSGHVTAAENGAAVAGARVTAVGPYGSYADTTDAAGDYLIGGLPAGGYLLAADSPLFLPSAPESLDVPAMSVRDFSLMRPIITLNPTSLAAIVASGDTLCLPLVVHNSGTAPLVLTGQRREETPASPNGLGSGETTTGPEYERVLEDPALDTSGPDLLALDVERTPTQLNFRLTLAADPTAVPMYGFLSIDTDRNPTTGANPPAFGHGLPGQNVGAEYEVVIDNICSGYLLIEDAVTGDFLTSVFVFTEGNAILFSVPLSALGNPLSANVCVTAMPGYCDGGSTRPGLGPRPRAAGAPPANTGVTTTDWMPETGQGTIGSCGWLSVTPREATVAAGDSLTLNVCIDARALSDTTVVCTVSLASNDPRRPLAALPLHVVVSGTSATPEPGGATPGVPRFALRQNEPNPFRESTRIRFSLPHEDVVRLSIFDLSGRLVWRPVEGRKPAGEHEVVLDASHRLPGGIYFYRLESGGRVATRKLLVVN